MVFTIELEKLASEFSSFDPIAVSLNVKNIAVLLVAISAEKMLVSAAMTDLTAVVTFEITDIVVVPVSFVPVDGTECK